MKTNTNLIFFPKITRRKIDRTLFLPEHEVLDYLNSMQEEEIISDEERQLICQALWPLFFLIEVSEETIEEINREMSKDKNTYSYHLADDEYWYWINSSLSSTEAPIPGFDWKEKEKIFEIEEPIYLKKYRNEEVSLEERTFSNLQKVRQHYYFSLRFFRKEYEKRKK